jgi:hypothetical protein
MTEIKVNFKNTKCMIDKKANITNVTSLKDDKILVSCAHNRYPLIEFDIGKEIIKQKEPIDVLKDVNVKFVGTLKNNSAYIVIPKHKFELLQISTINNVTNIANITINNKSNLRDIIIQTIVDSNPELCKCKDCYHLIGFIELCEFNLVVQQVCSHNNSSRKIFFLRASLYSTTLINLSLLCEIDFYKYCRNNRLRTREAVKSIITSVTTNGSDKIYLISAYGNKGYFWSIPYFSGLTFIGSPNLITKLHHSPRGITYTKDYDTCVRDNNNNNNKDNLLVVCDNDNKLSYYIISIL